MTAKQCCLAPDQLTLKAEQDALLMGRLRDQRRGVPIAHPLVGLAALGAKGRKRGLGGAGAGAGNIRNKDEEQRDARCLDPIQPDEPEIKTGRNACDRFLTSGCPAEGPRVFSPL
jgi:hypothetical protein